MVPNNDGKGPGDAPAPKRKRAPSARKRAPKSVKAAEQDTTLEAGQPAGAAPPAPQDQADGTDRGRKGAVTRDAVSTPRAADQADAGDPRFGEAQAERAAELANDLKSWMDTRREDKDEPREVL